MTVFYYETLSRKGNQKNLQHDLYICLKTLFQSFADWISRNEVTFFFFTELARIFLCISMLFFNIKYLLNLSKKI